MTSLINKADRLLKSGDLFAAALYGAMTVWVLGVVVLSLTSMNQLVA